MKTTHQKIFTLGIVLLLLILNACSSKDDIYADIDYKRLTYLIQDSPGMTYYALAMNKTGQSETLLKDGPYTVFVPNDNSFIKQGYTQESLASTTNKAWLSQLVSYCITPGHYDLQQIPFGFNTAVRSLNGHYLYITQWLEGQDTVIAVNGVRTLKTNVQGNNGFIQVLSGIPSINTYGNLAARVADVDNLTLFSHAIKMSGMEALLTAPGHYTVFAPSNDAMKVYGFSNIQDVEVAHPDTLAQLIRRHILPTVYFRNDFRLLTPYNETANPGQGLYFDVDNYNWQTHTITTEKTYISGQRGSFTANMLDNTAVTFTYTYGDGYDNKTNLDRLTLTSGTITANALVGQQDQVADNGVIHVINAVLPTN